MQKKINSTYKYSYSNNGGYSITELLETRTFRHCL